LIFQLCVWDPKIGVWNPQGVPGPQVKNHCHKTNRTRTEEERRKITVTLG